MIGTCDDDEHACSNLLLGIEQKESRICCVVVLQGLNHVHTFKLGHGRAVRDDGFEQKDCSCGNRTFEI